MNWRNLLRRTTIDEQALTFDLTWMAVYLAAASTRDPDRKSLLEGAGRQALTVAAPFRQAHSLVAALGFDHATALERVADGVHARSLRELLLRFGRSIAAGAPESDHFRREHDLAVAEFRNGYERDLENLRQWLGAYSALNLSAVLLMAVTMVVSLVFAVSSALIINLSAGLLAMIVIGTHTVGRTAPVERRSLPDDQVPELRTARMLVALLPVGALVGQRLAAVHGTGALLMAMGAALLPAGIAALLGDRRVGAADAALPDLVRRLGALSAELRTTTAGAIRQLPTAGAGVLSRPLERLQQRLAFGLDEERAWSLFARETGSSMVAQTLTTYRDAVRLGTPPQAAAQLCGAHAERVGELRAKRLSVADPYVTLLQVLNALTTAVLLVMLQTTVFFTAQFEVLTQEVRSSFPANPMGFVPTMMIQTPDADLYQAFSLALVLLSAVSVSVVCVWIRGSHWLTGFLYGGLTLAVSGGLLWAMPQLMAQLFSFTIAQ